jgi:YggT family protein
MLISPLQNALLFTISTVFNMYIAIVIIRFLLQLVRADFYNPIAQLIVKATNPLLVPLRKIIPGYAKIDFASVVLALTLQITQIYLTLAIKGFGIDATATSIGGLFIWSFGELVDLLLTIWFFATFIQVIGSWLAPQQYNNPALMLVDKITAPLFKPIHKVLPNFGGIDLSPIVVIFLISLARMLISDPIVMFGKSLI